jgi:hypothetical protein
MPIRKTRNKRQGKVRNAQPIKVDGIQFRSKLEAYTYNKLKEAGLTFDYEKERFELMPKFTTIGDSYEMTRRKGEKVFIEVTPHVRAITYTPDFTNTEAGWIIECKGNPNDAFPLRWKLFKKYLKDNDLKYDLYLPRNRKQVDKTVELIRNRNESFRTK